MLGSAGSNRIRSAILQVIVGVVDHGLQRARRGARAARALRGRRRLRRARHRRRRAARRRPRGASPSATATSSSAASRRSSATGPPARSRAPATRGAAAPRWPREARGARRRSRRSRRWRSARCGSEARDLFLVTRSGDVPGARLTLRITDDGRASCNGKPLVDITSAQLIAARESERDLEQAGQGPAAPAPRRASRSSPTACAPRRAAWPGATTRARQPRGPLQAGQAHARRGQGALPPGALAAPASALQQSRFRRGPSAKAPLVRNQERETHGGQQRCRLHGRRQGRGRSRSTSRSSSCRTAPACTPTTSGARPSTG